MNQRMPKLLHERLIGFIILIFCFLCMPKCFHTKHFHLYVRYKQQSTWPIVFIVVAKFSYTSSLCLKAACHFQEVFHFVLARTSHTSMFLGGFIKIQILTQQIWSGARDSAFLISSQMMLTLLMCGPHIGSIKDPNQG